MKIWILIIVILIAGCGQAWAEDDQKWTSVDTGLQATYTVLHVMDWTQTLRIARDHKTGHNARVGGEPYYEAKIDNIIGKYPTKEKVDTYFMSTLILHSIISYSLPKPYRTIWQSFWIGVEYNQIQRNRDIGLGISLHF